MKKTFLTQWFESPDLDRGCELTECFVHNTALGFDEVIVFTDQMKFPEVRSGLRIVHHTARITFFDFLKLLDARRDNPECFFFSNSDIKLDPKILTLGEILEERDLVCLSRYELSGELVQNPWCSQDTWVALTQAVPLSVLVQSGIPLGLPGCENRFAEVCFSAGFRLLNPCLDIRNIHCHRRQVAHESQKRLYGAYGFVHPCDLASMKSGRDWAQMTYLKAEVKLEMGVVS